MGLYVIHDSHKLFYREPFGAVACGQKMILRLAVRSELAVTTCDLRLWEMDQEKIISMSQSKRHDDLNSAGDKLAQEFSKPPSMLGCKSNESTVYFEVEYEAPEIPGLVWYYFIVSDGFQTIYYGNNKEQRGGLGRLWQQEPPSYQMTVYRPMKVPEWYQRGVIYQIFVDRFYNSSPHQMVLHREKTLLHSDWFDTPVYIKDEQGRVTHWDFFGGNLLGLIEKLPYLKELGISILYLNPIFEAASNHKYDTADYHAIDSMYGDEETFKCLLDSARQYGISVILDGVFSHTGSDSIYFNRYGRYPELGAYQSEKSPYYSWYRFKPGTKEYKCWWNVEDLPEIDEMNPTYRRFIYGSNTSVIHKWMSKGVAGWRLDVADELPDEFIRELRQAVKAINPEAVLIGEVWEDASNKISYGQFRKYLWGDELDGVMNYPLRETLLSFILGSIDSQDVHLKMMSLYENYPRENFFAAMNLIGSHDRPRVLTLLGDAPAEEDLLESERRSYYLSPSKRSLALARLKILSLLQMTFPGVPCVYYGDEAGVEGYSDPYNRKTFPWGREDREILEWYKRIIRWRSEYEVLLTGGFHSFTCGKDVYGFSRIGNREEITVFINRHVTETRECAFIPQAQISSLVIDLLSGEVISEGETKSLTLVISPLSMRIFYCKESIRPERSGMDSRSYEKTLTGLAARLPRLCGVLMHITSLPSRWNAGDLGEGAYEFVDFLALSGQSLWQVLPLNPVGLGDSPYQSESAFAGNPMLISLEHLMEEGLLDPEKVHKEYEKQVHILKTVGSMDSSSIDQGAIKKWKNAMLREAFSSYSAGRAVQKSARFLSDGTVSTYLSAEAYSKFLFENRGWLEDYALFRSLKGYYGSLPWQDWEPELVSRHEETLKKYRQLLAEEIEFNCFVQYTFYHQWQKLRNYAKTKGIKLIGDMPLFVAADSCDVWVHRKFFKLDSKGTPALVAGVPPDYFSKTGQLWGNPVYDWEALALAEYSWWKERIGLTLHLFDYIRVDHFRGLESYWEIKAGEETAIKGRWMKGPGKRFFESLIEEFGELPLIAEDLGILTPEVKVLRQIFGFPGMKVLQFTPIEEIKALRELKEAKGAGEENFIYYTGTHDNDTLLGWYKSMFSNGQDAGVSGQEQEQEQEQEEALKACRDLIENLYFSQAAWVITPLQDILGLDSETRMNIPGTVKGNWQWRMPENLLTDEVKNWLKALAQNSKRLPVCNPLMAD